MATSGNSKFCLSGDVTSLKNKQNRSIKKCQSSYLKEVKAQSNVTKISNKTPTSTVKFTQKEDIED